MFSDEELLSNLRGDGVERDRAITQLRDVLVRGLSKSLNNRYGQPFQVEDVVQEALIKILNSLDQFQGRSKFTTWSMTVATRIGISSLRRKYHQDVSLDAFQTKDGGRIEVAIESKSSTNNPGELREILEVLQRLIDTELTEKQRVAMRALLSDYSSDGIAERMGMSRNAIYKLIHDARIKLKNGFIRSGVSPEDIQTAFAARA